ncbi:hypothetical protein [Tenacibaculum finnmarkense]|uniref:hypothetical protein n=1 Tax=Tenacibaculum finnmarkense TaxID=2781243 RepID=UPI00187B351A|nr:hypothetical protein [Tenacibaculum finnmarkense]MBE7692826.1 hypothetical protein [Tenacibaculum finnmarkense genomovar finnmarkense]
MNKEEYFFDELKKRADNLHSNSDRDNESSRHDLLIYPTITSEYGLGWNPIDLISQSTIKIPKEIEDSHIFRGAVPKIRKPDILIFPNEIIKNVAVIEEKKRQESVQSLANHKLQLSEYQALYECTWGVLTDGEKWIIKRNFETFHEFSTIDELRKGIKDFRHCIGSKEIINRYNQYNTFDYIIISPFLNNFKTAFPEFDNIPVVVCGINKGKVTENGSGFKNYKNLKSALLEYPDLHPKLHTKRFTWAIKEKENDKIKKLRFESWIANDVYSR